MLATTGVEGSTEVVAVEDTGTMINMNPVVRLTLKVMPAVPEPASFETVAQTAVSKIAIPRKGDTFKIEYNFANPAEFIVLS